VWSLPLGGDPVEAMLDNAMLEDIASFCAGK